jgi:hypothetical protein
MISEYTIGKDMKGSRCDLVAGSIEVFVWKDWGNSRKELSHDIESMDQHMNTGPSECESGVPELDKYYMNYYLAPITNIASVRNLRLCLIDLK